MPDITAHFDMLHQHEQIVNADDPNQQVLISRARVRLVFPDGHQVNGMVTLKQPRGYNYDDPIEVADVANLVGDRPFNYNTFSDVAEEYFRRCLAAMIGWGPGSRGIIMRDNVMSIPMSFKFPI